MRSASGEKVEMNMSCNAVELLPVAFDVPDKDRGSPLLQSQAFPSK